MALGWQSSIQTTIDTMCQWLGLIGGGLVACWFLYLFETRNFRYWKAPAICAVLLVVFILALEAFKVMSLPGVP